MSISKKDLMMLRLKKVGEQQTLLKEYVKAGHALPKNRREFLSAGLTSMAGMMLMPTLAQLISSSAWADVIDCSAASATASSDPVFINIQLNGGAALFANHIPRGANGNPLSDHTKLGIGANPTVENLFSTNAPFWVAEASLPASGMVRGLFSSLSKTGPDADIYAKTAFVSVAAESLDDQAGRGKKADLSGLLQAGGFIGSTLPYLVTGYGGFLNETLATAPSNLFSNSALYPAATQLSVQNISAIESSIKLQGALGTLPTAMQSQLMTTIEKLNKHQVKDLANDPNSHDSKKTFKNLIECSVTKNKEVLAGNSIVNYTNTSFPNSAALTAIWAKNKSSQTGATNSSLTSKGFNGQLMDAMIERSAYIVTNCMRGFSGAGFIDLGGYDYHLSFYNRAEAELKDNFFGDIIGRTLRTAKVFGRKVFIYISTNGSLTVTASSSPDTPWAGDNPKRSMNYILAYDPSKTPSTGGLSLGNDGDAPYQLNHFNSSHVVDNTNPISNLDAEELLAAAVFLNFLNFAGKSNLINSPALALAKNKLMSALPSGAGDIFNYYTRIKS